MNALCLTAPENFAMLSMTEPSSPGAGEVLVAVHRVGICGTDLSGYLGKMPFIQYPRVLGHELAVEVLAIGPGVLHLKVGDYCAVEPYLHCGECGPCALGRTNCCESLKVLGVHVHGGMRERLLLPAGKLHQGNGLPLESLALVETLAIGCHAVNRASIKKDEEVVIIGAGPIGLTVLIFARLAGARITVLERSETRSQFVRALYPEIRVMSESPDAAIAHAVFDATGNPESMSRALRLAYFGGRIIYVGITSQPVPLDDALFHRRELTLLASRNALADDFSRILALMASGEVQVASWITHGCNLEELPKAMPKWLQPASGVIKAMVTVSSASS
jgi:2-desacetyl-2-hydroxyethyl bacteriochlorophyllide A dehydrogenase